MKLHIPYILNIGYFPSVGFDYSAQYSVHPQVLAENSKWFTHIQVLYTGSTSLDASVQRNIFL